MDMDYITRFILKVRPAFLAALLKIFIPFKWKDVDTPYGIFHTDVISHSGYGLLKTGVREQHTVNILQKILKQGDVFLDVGAHEGFFSVVASKLVGKKGRVIAIEPQKRLQKLIAKNLELNSCSNVTVLPVAVADYTGDGQFYNYPNVNTGASSLHRTTFYLLPKQKVKIITLLDVFNQVGLNYIDVVKIDIEGGEYNAIFGSKKVFADKKIGSIIIEFHPRALLKQGKSKEQIIRFLMENGYVPDDNLFMLN